MKINDVQAFRLRLAYDQLTAVLREIKNNKLDTEGRKFLKDFEEAAIRVEFCLMTAVNIRSKSEATR
ncbi:MAG: hypothetical protein NT105_23790 [Verrucomicrobia bacterium]|nr:hypothetical protein [Verrucomicrobiota bacterium]